MKKVLLIVFGVLIALGGLVLAAGGIALMALFGSDGIYDAPQRRVDTATHALVSEPVELKNDAPFHPGYGDVTIRLRAQGSEGGAVFLGLGPAADVDRYLSGVAHDVVTEWRYHGNGDSITKTRVDGARTPAPPGEASFWTVRAEGRGEQHLSWRLRSGTYRLVVMNADGAAAVDVRGKWGVEIPWIFPLGIGLLVGGVLVLAVGIVLFVLGLRTRAPTPATPATTAGAWTAPQERARPPG
jgi:hypothetical protein